MQDPPAPDYPRPAVAWFMVVMLTIAYILSFVDRYVLGLLIEPIKADFGLSDTQMGLLGGFAFGIFYTTMGLPLGYLADRKRRTWLVAAGIAVWSAATAASGIAKNFLHLFIARVSVGVGEATLSPCAMSMISDSFPPERRGKPIALYTAALSLGAGIASIVSAAVLGWAKSVPRVDVPLVGDVAPWQLTFFIVGLPGLLLAVVFVFLREPTRIDESGSGIRRGAGLIEMLRYVGARWRLFGSFVIFVCLMTICAYSQFFFAPMFQRTWGWPPETYGIVNGIVLLATGPLVVNLAGAWSDRLYSRGVADAPFRIVLLGAFILVPTGVIAPLMPTPELAIAVLVVNTAGIACTSATSVTALLNITPGPIRAQTVALYYMAISLAGLFLGPSAVGLMSDYLFSEQGLFGGRLVGLRYAISAVPLLFGLLVLPFAACARRVYNAELRARAEAA